MSIEKKTLSDGSYAWLARVRTPDGRRRSKQFPRKKDAQAWEAQQRVDLRRGDWIDPLAGRITVTDWVETWKRDYTAGLRDSTQVQNFSYLANHVEPQFGGYPLEDLDRGLLQAWVTDLSAKGLAPGSVAKAVGVLRKVLGAAVDARRLRSNPAANLKLPRDQHREQRFLTVAEINALAASIDGRYATAIQLASYTGLRAGELFGLKWGKVDLLRERLTVDEIVKEVRGTIQTDSPKTAAGRRSVQLPKSLVDDLSRHTNANPDLAAYVFPGPHGGPVRLSSWRRRFFYPAAVSARLATWEKVGDTQHYEGLRIHDLRHTAVGLWIAAGASPVEIAKRAGHESVVTVLNRYGHLLPSTEEAVTKALDQLRQVG